MCWILNVPVSLMFCIFQSSDSVSLDLLTYADLEALRDRKSSSCLKSSHGANGSGRSVALNTKRYLILTYTVEFDRFSIWDHVQILGEQYCIKLVSGIFQNSLPITSTLHGQTQPSRASRNNSSTQRRNQKAQTDGELRLLVAFFVRL